jgi:hypothetical protein
MADVKQQLLAAGCPPDLAEKIASPRVGAAPGQVGGIFGNLQFLRKLAGLLSQDGPTLRKVVQEVMAAAQSGNWLGLITLAQTDGPAVWQVLQDLAGLFGIDANPAPAAFEAGVSQR